MRENARHPAFAILAGVFFFIVIIKFGDPVVIDTDALTPGTAFEFLLGPWPARWAYWVLAPMVLGGIVLGRWKTARWSWQLFLPLAWLVWQFVSATRTVDPALTHLALRHFTACVALFYLGYAGLNGIRWPWPFLAGVVLAFCWVMRTGVEQHFGGLAATRAYIQSTYGSNWPEVMLKNPDFAKRIESDRIFGTFVYPNALAGGILLFLPLTLVFVWQITPKVPLLARAAFVAVLGGCGLATLYWSGSKAGWLLAVVLILIVLAHSKLPMKWRIGLIGAFLVLGLTGFAIRFSRYFQKGATSVSARFDYWRAAAQTIRTHPIVGSGPGTFMRPYEKLKDPKSEMARLCHNDYLEQGSDSGIPGMLAYGAFISWAVYRLYRYRIIDFSIKEPLLTALALGVIGICLHSFVEYHLYIPALAWPLFFILGWLASLDVDLQPLSLKS